MDEIDNKIPGGMTRSLPSLEPSETRGQDIELPPTPRGTSELVASLQKALEETFVPRRDHACRSEPTLAPPNQVATTLPKCLGRYDESLSKTQKVLTEQSGPHFSLIRAVCFANKGSNR
jgi:hypothetical protein